MLRLLKKLKPNINIGDIVIINQKYDNSKLKINDVIAYEYENKIIIHRLVKIEKVTKTEYYYYTKGDANNAMDNYIVYENMIKGIVEEKIPYLGYPTIWINRIK
jgi:signal peptidase I